MSAAIRAYSDQDLVFSSMFFPLFLTAGRVLK